jgi:hypothetical protein
MNLGQNLRSRALEMLNPDSLNEHEREEYRKLLTRHAPEIRNNDPAKRAER